MDLLKLPRSIWLEVDLDCIKGNFARMREKAGPGVKVMPAVKANAYSHGIAVCARALEEAGADYLGVGSLDEAISLRGQGIAVPILVFAGNLVCEQAPLYVRHGIIPTILYPEQAASISEAATSPHPVFVKIETGRGRLGINAEEAAEVIGRIAAMPNIRVEGLYSHMGGADWPENQAERDYAMWQHERFRLVAEALERQDIHIPFRQLANTPASIAYPDLRMTGICPGRAIWGVSPLERRAEHPDLRPAMRAWKTRLVQVKEVIGGKLGPNFSSVRLESPRRIGVMPGGLSDGVSPRHAQGGQVLLHGRRAPVCSPVSLEHLTVDLTDFPDARPGDEVVLMGRQGKEEITQKDLMALWNRDLMELWTAIPASMARAYYEGGDLRCIAHGDRVEERETLA